MQSMWGAVTNTVTFEDGDEIQALCVDTKLGFWLVLLIGIGDGRGVIKVNNGVDRCCWV